MLHFPSQQSPLGTARPNTHTCLKPARAPPALLFIPSEMPVLQCQTSQEAKKAAGAPPAHGLSLLWACCCFTVVSYTEGEREALFVQSNTVTLFRSEHFGFLILLPDVPMGLFLRYADVCVLLSPTPPAQPCAPAAPSLLRVFVVRQPGDERKKLFYCRSTEMIHC